MFRVILFLVLAACVVATATGGGLAPDAKTEVELRALRSELLDAMKRGDEAVLQRLLADGFVFVHSTGTMERRDAFIARTVAAAAKPAPGGGVEFLEDDLRSYDGRTIVWVTRSRRQAPAPIGELNFRGTDVLAKLGDRWQWISVQSTRLPTRPRAFALDAAQVAAIAGRYELAPQRALVITNADGTLRAELPGTRPAELIPLSASELAWFDPESNLDARLVVERDGEGAIVAIALRREGAQAWRALRVP